MNSDMNANFSPERDAQTSANLLDWDDVRESLPSVLALAMNTEEQIVLGVAWPNGHHQTIYLFPQGSDNFRSLLGIQIPLGPASHDSVVALAKASLRYVLGGIRVVGDKVVLAHSTEIAGQTAISLAHDIGALAGTADTLQNTYFEDGKFRGEASSRHNGTDQETAPPDAEH